MLHHRRSLLLLAAFWAAGCSDEALTHPPDDAKPASSSSSAGSGGEGGGGGGGGGEGGTATEPGVHFVDGDGMVVTRIRYGEPFAVVVDGLLPKSEVTVDSTLRGYQGWATFAASADGSVDTRIDAPSAGTYDGAEPEGLLWSMLAGRPSNDMTLDITVSAKMGDQVVAKATLERAWLDENLVSQNVTDDGLVGRLFKPAEADGPLPGLIIVGGSEGGIESASFEAAWFAGYGYAALALAYFDEPGLPAELSNIPLEYFSTAIDVLSSRPDVDPERIGVIGGSRGGELVLMLGEYFPEVRAVVAEVPSGVRWGAVNTALEAAWTYQGTPLPYLVEPPDAQPVVETLPNGETAYRLTPVFQKTVDTATPEDLAASTIQVENTNGPILMLAGKDDALWPSCTLSSIAMDRLEATGHAAKGDKLLCFADAGHFAPLPGWPTTESYAIDFGPYWLVLGGSAKGTAHAKREGLTALRSFLAEHLQNP